MERDKKRFKAADQDGDNKLSKKGRKLHIFYINFKLNIKNFISEYADFLHPEESKAMRNIVIDVSLFYLFII